MRVLAVRQPWASLIVEGLKTIEIRSRPTNIRERIGIYSTKTNANRKDCDFVKDVVWDLQSKYKITLQSKYFVPYNYKLFPTGQFMGTVEIESCEKLGIADFSGEVSGRYASFAPNIHRGKSYFWNLRNPIKLKNPIPIKWPSTGSWANVEESILKLSSL